MNDISINIRDDSEDVILITGFDDAYRARQNANMRVPDLDDDIAELLSQFRFIAFFFYEVELLTAVTHYCQGDFEFPGKNFAKFVKRIPQPGHSLQEWVAPDKRQHTIIYFSHKNYENISRSTIGLFDRYDMDQDPEFLFMTMMRVLPSQERVGSCYLNYFSGWMMVLLMTRMFLRQGRASEISTVMTFRDSKDQ
ncbi:hypothetical protein COL922a_006657 [Colletotrichum nupharicola]|nr:hypothetical protein COL922a_006657 [Colletotrichum nupharicola]